MAPPKIQRPLKLIRAIKCRGHFPTLHKAMLWYNAKTNNGQPMIHLHKVFGRGGRDNCSYPAVGIRKEKIMVHVLLMMYKLGGNVPDDKYVHHKNEDKTDWRLCNLELIDISEHQRMHNFGPDCSRWRGRKLTTASNEPITAGSGIATALHWKPPITSPLPF